MPSVSHAQAALMAAAAHNPAFAKRAGVPQRVARDFNHADKGTGILRRAMGGPMPQGRGGSPLMLTFQDMFRSPAQSFFAQAPGPGQAMSAPSRAIRTDRKIARADRDLNRLTAKFAEGGSAKVGVSPASLKKMKDTIAKHNDRDRELALQTLRESRAQIAGQETPATTGPATRLLNTFVIQPALPQRPPAPPPAAPPPMAVAPPPVAMAEGGEVQDPTAIYTQYVQLLEQLEDPETPADTQSEILAKMEQLEQQLEALGINVAWDPQQESADAGAGES